MNNNKALVLIDMQREDGFSLENHATVIAHNVALLAAARERNIPVVYSRHINDNDLPPGEPLAADGKADSYRIGTYQVEIIEALAPHKGDMVIDKTRYSAFHKTDLDAQLKAKGIDTLIVTGVLTDACVLATVFDAFALGYHIQLITDACTTTTLAAHYSALLIMANWVYSIELFNCAEFLRALNGEAFTSCRPAVPDQFAHQPEELPHTIVRLHTSLSAQESRP